MFEDARAEPAPADDVRGVAAALLAIGDGHDDAERIDLIRALEELKCVAEGAQAELTAAFDRSQREAERAAGVPAERQGRGVAAQVALARRESPHRGRQHLGLALVLRDEMPCTSEALRTGRITEWRATLLARETACLSRADRAAVDRRIAGDLDAVEAMGDGELVGRARELAYERDPVSFVERRRRAEAERRVSVRPAPDTMAHVSALVSARDGVAVWAVLSREADQRKSLGDERSRGQIMADTLVARVLADGEGSHPDLMINVVVPDSVLLGDDEAGGWVEHYGPVPGELLRAWIADNAERGVDQFVRRLYATPATGALVARTPRAGGSMGGWRSSCDCATVAVAPSGVTLRSDTSTTPRTTRTAVRRAPTTAKGCVRTATSPSRRSAGRPDLGPGLGTPSRPSHRPVTATPPPPRPRARQSEV